MMLIVKSFVKNPEVKGNGCFVQLMNIKLVPHRFY